ncbi:DUF3734 domain-containing protein [Burkholderia sp. PU8-34]
MDEARRARVLGRRHRQQFAARPRARAVRPDRRADLHRRPVYRQQADAGRPRRGDAAPRGDQLHGPRAQRPALRGVRERLQRSRRQHHDARRGAGRQRDPPAPAVYPADGQSRAIHVERIALHRTGPVTFATDYDFSATMIAELQARGYAEGLKALAGDEKG